MRKCLWCQRDVSEAEGIAVQYDFGPEAFCSEPCQEHFTQFYQYARSRIKYLIALILLISVVGIAVTVWRMPVDNGALGTFICLGGLGAAVVKYPITTPQFVRLVGGRRAIVYGRRMGYACIVLGAVLAALVYVL